jgi:hypothetical protein
MGNTPQKPEAKDTNKDKGTAQGGCGSSGCGCH